jgi:hypothetical protein
MHAAHRSVDGGGRDVTSRGLDLDAGNSYSIDSFSPGGAFRMLGWLCP